jgi:tRNA-dihydrouridine synthase
VVSKGKGAGMLAEPEELARFLDEVFAKSPLPISVKTRIGLHDPEEFPALLEVFNRYPIKELTVHPRVRKQFYSGDVDREMFRYAAEHAKMPLCYNGDITSREEADAAGKQFPMVEAVMIGRGLVADPGMLLPGGTKTEVLEAFHDELLEEYLVLFGGSRNAMFRLKENWSYLLTRFENSEKLAKQLRKTTDLSEYRSVVYQIFHTLPRK